MGDNSRDKTDPTALTTDALLREIARTEQLFDTKLDAAEKLRNERLHALEQRLDAAESRRRESKADDKSALDAALAAAKEAVHTQNIANQRAIEKSESSMGEQIKNLRRELDEIKSSQAAQVGQKVGSLATRSGIIAAISVSVTLLVFVMTVVTFVIARAN